MKKDTSITVRIDSELKTKAEAVMNSYGLTMTAAVDLLLHQIVRQNAIPLSLTLNEPDPILAGVERARTARAQGYQGADARAVAKKMCAVIAEVGNGDK